MSLSFSRTIYAVKGNRIIWWWCSFFSCSNISFFFNFTFDSFCHDIHSNIESFNECKFKHQASRQAGKQAFIHLVSKWSFCLSPDTRKCSIHIDFLFFEGEVFRFCFVVIGIFFVYFLFFSFLIRTSFYGSIWCE